MQSLIVGHMAAKNVACHITNLWTLLQFRLHFAYHPLCIPNLCCYFYIHSEFRDSNDLKCCGKISFGLEISRNKILRQKALSPEECS